MPGTPSTSPRAGAPRFSDSDPASFSQQVNGVTDSFDSYLQRHTLVPTYQAGDYTAVAGDLVVFGGSSGTITLPATPNNGDLVEVRNLGGGACTVSGGIVTGDGGTTFSRAIIGAGVQGTAPLSAQHARLTVVYIAQQNAWVVVDGEIDTGWVSLTLAIGVTILSTLPPAARQIGNRVQLRGIFSATSSIENANPATLPSAVQKPTETIVLQSPTSQDGSDYWLETDGTINWIYVPSTNTAPTAHLNTVSYLTD